MGQFVDRVKVFFGFSKKEYRFLLITALISGIILSFRMWGDQFFDVEAGIANLLTTTIMAMLALLIHFGAQKLYAVRKGYKHEYVMNPLGMGIGAFITILFNGLFFIVAPGYLAVKSIPKQRVGKWRFRPYFREYAFMSQFGIFANLFVAGVFSFFTGNLVVLQFVKVNIFIALCSLIPAPRFDGFHIFFGSWFQYVFVTTFTLVFAGLVLLTNAVSASVVALLASIAGFFILFNQAYT